MGNMLPGNQEGHSNSLDKKDFMGDVFKDITFQPEFSYFEESEKALTSLSWRNLSLKIKDKEILQNVSGHVNGGEICALMGPSGAGKSSLLNVLAGRLVSGRNKRISGEVKVNGQTINPSSYRTNIAYVLQEDCLFATATAKESLELSARLRLPTSTPKEVREKIVEDLLLSLGLDHVRDTMVGSELVKGLSGGEKKRVAIGIELVTNPSLLFLDEPTSGLDSFSAWKVVKILESLSNSTGCAVLCTIHQPSSEIFNSFDQTLFLTRGRVMYNGSVADMPVVLMDQGYPVPPRTNPADYAMLVAQTAGENMPNYNPDAEGENVAVAEVIDEGIPVSGRRTAGIITQAKVLAVREFRNFYRDVGFLVANIVITLFLNLIFGSVFFQAAARDEPDYSIAGGYGALLLVLISAMFGAAQGPLLTFPLERAVMIREYQTGTYSAFPYLLSKLLVEIPRYFLISFLVLLASYWLIGYNGNFFYLLMVIFVIEIVVASYAFVLGAAVTDAKQGQEFAPLLLVPQLLFTGLFAPVDQIPEWLRWIQYICVLKYGVNLGALVEFGDCDDFNNNTALEQQCEALLDANDISRDYVARDVAVLAAIFVGFRALSLYILIYRAKHFSN